MALISDLMPDAARVAALRSQPAPGYMADVRVVQGRLDRSPDRDSRKSGPALNLDRKAAFGGFAFAPAAGSALASLAVIVAVDIAVDARRPAQLWAVPNLMPCEVPNLLVERERSPSVICVPGRDPPDNSTETEASSWNIFPNL